jgi:hypothetical protein
VLYQLSYVGICRDLMVSSTTAPNFLQHRYGALDQPGRIVRKRRVAARSVPGEEVPIGVIGHLRGAAVLIGDLRDLKLAIPLLFGSDRAASFPLASR